MQIAFSLLAGSLIAASGLGPDQTPSNDCPENAPNVIAASFVHAEDDEYEAPAEPGLEVGDEAPTIELLDEKGNTIDLADLYAQGPIVLTFYRGGWCPYCSKALSAWQQKLPELKEAGGTFVGLTPQKPSFVAETKQDKELEYVVLSDTDGEAGRAFKVTFSLDDRTIEKYKGYGIDLAKNNADGEWTLPAPATFVIDTEGVIQWVFADWDYTKRADPDAVIEAVRKITGE